MRRSVLLITALAVGASSLPAQSGALEEYVALGLRQNLGLRQEDLAVRRSAAAVREARGGFFPSATVNARHTDIRGRVVDLGELINPAFAALNQILGAPNFPTDIDLRLPLRQETSVRIEQPVFQPAIYAGYRAATAARDAQEASRDASVLAIAAEIRSAYLQHAKALRLSELRVAMCALFEEQVRVVGRLIEAGRATSDALSRAQAELSDATQREAEAARLASASAQTFNMLLGRTLTDPVIVEVDGTFDFAPMPTLAVAITAGNGGRAELRAVEAASRVARAQQRAAQGSFLPTVAVAVDYGVQGNAYRFSGDADFTSLSVVASWNLFNGGRDAARAEQASLDARRLALRGDDTRRSVELQVRLAWQAAEVARTAITTAGDQRAAAARTHALVRRRAEEGLASPLELSQASTALTAAEVNAILITYDYYLRRVELDHAAALYPRTTP